MNIFLSLYTKTPLTLCFSHCHSLQWHFGETHNFLITVHEQCHKSVAQLPVLTAVQAANHGADHKRSR